MQSISTIPILLTALIVLSMPVNGHRRHECINPKFIPIDDCFCVRELFGGTAKRHCKRKTDTLMPRTEAKLAFLAKHLKREKLWTGKIRKGRCQVYEASSDSKRKFSYHRCRRHLAMPCVEVRPFGEWEEWSEYSPCAGGKRYRTRKCKESCCIGASYEEEKCTCTENQWGEWGDWSQCACDVESNVGKRYRTRKCLSACCVGDNKQTENCDFVGTWGDYGSWKCSIDFHGNRECHKTRECQTGCCTGDSSLPDACPNDYKMMLPGQCYKIDHSETVTQREAIDKCQDDGGGVLPEPTTEEEHELFLKEFRKARVWLGFSDEYCGEGNFVHISDHRNMTFHKWGPHQPDNHQGSEHCVTFQESHNYPWNDLPCGDWAYRVCQINIH